MDGQTGNGGRFDRHEGRFTQIDDGADRAAQGSLEAERGQPRRRIGAKDDRRSGLTSAGQRQAAEIAGVPKCRPCQPAARSSNREEGSNLRLI